MMGIVLRFVPAVILGFILSAGSYFNVGSSILSDSCGGSSSISLSDDVCIPSSLRDRGFPVSIIEEEARSFSSADSTPESSIVYGGFFANWAVWSVTVAVFLFAFRKLRKVIGNAVIFGLGVALVLTYFGIIVYA